MDRLFPRLLALSLAIMPVLTACASAKPSASTSSATAIPLSVATAPVAATETSQPSASTPLQTSEPATLSATPAIEPAPPPATASAPTTESRESTVQWIRQQFGDVWDIEYPQGWTINDAGVYAGSLGVEGTYNARRYLVSFDVPILPPGISPSGDVAMLDAWVASEIAALPQEQQKAIMVEETIVAGAPARRILNMPDPATGEVTHRLYIWRSSNVNPRLIVIRPMDQKTLDRKEMQELLDRFGASVR